MISRKMMSKFYAETLKNIFLNERKIASRNIFWHFLNANAFMFTLLISNHTVFLLQFGINLHLKVFKKAETALAEAARGSAWALKTETTQ